MGTAGVTLASPEVSKHMRLAGQVLDCVSFHVWCASRSIVHIPCVSLWICVDFLTYVVVWHLGV